ncbi:hypothetical protein BGW42_004919 [Actinomortierella wolfii]|nr:hypothetical protein BGW42_004919 [Actinomortierella wolfii]
MALASLILFTFLAWQVSFNSASDEISPIAALGLLFMAVAWATAIPLNHAAHRYTVRSCSMIFAFFVISIAAVLFALYSSSASASPIFLSAISLSEHHVSASLFLSTLLATLCIGFVFEALPRGNTTVVRRAAENGVNIYDRVNLASRLSYHFLQPIMSLAAVKKTLDKDDVTNMLPDKVRAKNAASVLSASWEARLARYRARLPKAATEPQTWQPEDYPRHMLFWTLMSVYKWEIVPSILLRIFTALNVFVAPALMSVLLDYIEHAQDTDRDGEEKSVVYGLAIAFGMFVGAITGAVVYSYNTRWMMLTGQSIKSALSSLIFQKALRLSPGARQASSVGRMNNLLVVDTDTWQHAIDNLSVLFTIPLEIALALYMIYQLLGWPMFVGLATIVSMVPLQLWRAKKFEELEDKILKAKDERVRLVTQVLSSIKVIKLYNWEKPFMERVKEARKRELVIYRLQGVVEALISLVFASASTILMLTTITAYALWGGPNFTPGPLTAKTVFVTMTITLMLHGPVSRLSEFTADIVVVSVAARRMQRFLLLEELDPSEIVRESPALGKPAVELIDATFSWAHPDGQKVAGMNDGPDDEGDDDEEDTESDQEASQEATPLLSTTAPDHEEQNAEEADDQPVRPALENINLSIRPGELMVVVGRVGSGKSTLLSAILGETYRVRGRVIVRSSVVAYVPQQAWIINATVRDNILFGAPMDQAKYNRILFACGLEPDLAMLPAGDQTEIGERGINLSGGQKQRVALARAAYLDADLYLLDDPLSAVDAHVDKHLWTHLLGPEGLLGKKTRLLVTHGIHHLKSVDRIVVLRDGSIVENGTYSELMAARLSFYNLIKEYSIEHRRQLLGRRRSSGPGSAVASSEHHQNKSLLQVPGQENLSDSESARSILRDLDAEDQAALEAGGSVEDDDDRSSMTAENVDGMGVGAGKKAGDEEDDEDEDEDEDGQLIMDEYNKTGTIDWGLVKDYVHAASYKYMVIFVGLMVAAQVFWTLGSIWLMYGIDDNKQSDYLADGNKGDDDNKDFSLAWFLTVFALLSLAYVITSMLSLWMCFAVARVRAAEVIHTTMLQNVVRLPMSFYDTTPLGRIINRFSSDLYSIDENLPWRFLDLSFVSTSFLLSIFVVAYIIPVVLVVLPLMWLAYSWLQSYYLWASRALKRILSSAKSPVYAHFNETLDGLASIRAMNIQQPYTTLNQTRLDHFANSFVAYFQSHEWLGLRLESMQAIMGLVCAVAAVMARHTLSPAFVGLCLTYTLTMDEDLTWLMRDFGSFQTDLIALERVREYTVEVKTEAPATTTDPETLRILSSTAASGENNGNNSIGWPKDGAIEFVDYSTRYREGMDLVLRHVSFRVEPSEKIGIVGRTGAGKSSLTLALFRIIEAANSEWAKASDNSQWLRDKMKKKKQKLLKQGSNDGDIEEERQPLLANTDDDDNDNGEEDGHDNNDNNNPDLKIDGGKILIDGVDISKLGLDDLRSRLAIIPQDPTLFSGTIRDNLDPFNQFTDADLWAALERAHLKQHVATQLVGGLSARVSQNGDNFSVGQRSLLCLARALLRKTKVLVLDEATASVDVQTDELIQRTIRTEFADRTILTIAHRIKTVMDSDRILVLDAGRVVEFASPAELIQREDSLFRKLAAQAGEI